MHSLTYILDMLIDISDVLQICCYELGRTYLRVSQALCINVPSLGKSISIIINSNLILYQTILNFDKLMHKLLLMSITSMVVNLISLYFLKPKCQFDHYICALLVVLNWSKIRKFFTYDRLKQVDMLPIRTLFGLIRIIGWIQILKFNNYLNFQ